ncbi:MAG: V-type ATP synthase subunit I [Candidatus Micrarchaeota archaeon]|nr:V-type ATP synthase subunit I [Candidatus Micrarchaeota archaeon]
MLKSSHLEKIRIIVAKPYYEETLSALRDLGVMQIEILSEQDRSMLQAIENEGYKRISDYTQRFRSLEGMLHPHPTGEKIGFASISELIKAADTISIDARVANIHAELDRISVAGKQLSEDLRMLQKLKGFEKDISILSGSSVVSFVATGKELDKFVSEAARGIKDVIITKLEQSAIVSLKRSEEKSLGPIAEKYKTEMDLVPAMKGTVGHNTGAINGELSQMSRRRSELDAELDHISQRHYQEVSAIREQFDIELETLDATTKLGATDSAVVIEGWIIARSVPKLDSVLKTATKDHFVSEVMHTDQLPPTRLDNPVTLRIYEFFIRFYSLPKSDEIDPTLMFAMIFPVFFGLMIGDVVYGLIIFFGSLWLIRRINHPPKVSRLPKPIVKFVTNIISPRGMLTLSKAILPGAVIGVILGILFNTWAGFQLPYYQTPFPIEEGLPTLLKISGYIGVFMVMFGFVLGFLNKMAVGERKHAIGKLGWLAAAIGIVMFGLDILYKADMGVSNPEALASYVLLVGGIVTILKTEGVQSLMELPSLISHILSYTRLVGILLASVILAKVIDIIFLAGFRHGIILAVLGIIVFVVGQLFNLIIALFEPGIQGARLIYVEFFSKFFSGNGVEFKPFKSNRKHTLSRFSLEGSNGKPQ